MNVDLFQKNINAVREKMLDCILSTSRSDCMIASTTFLETYIIKKARVGPENHIGQTTILRPCEECHVLRSIDSVACDGCGNIFHVQCTDLKDQRLSRAENKKFICKSCNQSKCSK